MIHWILLNIFIMLFCAYITLFRNRTKVHRNDSKRIRIKNSIHNRMSSTRYSVAITLHALFFDDYKYKSCENNDDVQEQLVCFYCDTSLIDKYRAVDHIYPVIVNRKPSNRLVLSNWNKVVCCTSCNSQKSNHDCIQWMKQKGLNNEKIIRMKKRMSNIGLLTADDYKKLLSKFNHFMKIHEDQCDSLTTVS
jgi:hypothetical protein